MLSQFSLGFAGFYIARPWPDSNPVFPLSPGVITCIKHSSVLQYFQSMGK